MASDVAMSHEQMLHLLQQAHTRLQKKTDVSIMEKSAIDLKIPARNSLLAIAEAQLKGPESNKSLVTTTQHPGLAKSDNSLRARTVEDPVAVQKQKSAVCISLFIITTSLGGKFIPKSILDADVE